MFEAADPRAVGTLPSKAFRRCLLDGLGFELTRTECEDLLEYLVRYVESRLHAFEDMTCGSRMALGLGNPCRKVVTKEAVA